jgi:hypothetical protein
VGGIDTHLDPHVAAVVDRDNGRQLDTKVSSATRKEPFESFPVMRRV